MSGASAGPRHYGQFIGGTERLSASSFSATDPSTGLVWATLGEAVPADVDAAVAAARSAAPGWAATSLAQRQEALLRLGDLFEAADWPDILASENGRPIREARAGDTRAARAIFHYYAGLVRGHHGDALDLGPNVHVYTIREPLGVVAALLPWNAPAIELALKVAPALATGNTVVVKPSELASVSVLEFARRSVEVLPSGVLNVVTGHAEVGAALVSHSDIDKVTFTGGTGTARAILAATARTIVPTTMELGGKSAMIVAPDADIDAVVADAVNGIFHHNGQVCFAASRLYVHRRVYDEVVGRIVELAPRILVGDAHDPATQMGPLVTSAHRDQVLGSVHRAVEEGARVLAGGGHHASGRTDLEVGSYLEPTVLEDLSGETVATCDELFGPVLTVRPWEDEAEVVAWANSSQYGLAAGIWTRDLSRAHLMARNLRAGTVWVNTWLSVPPGQPLGGVKASGYGREMCAETLLEFSAPKSVHVRLDTDRPVMWG